VSAIDGRAVVYCEQAFGTPNGKTAHGLVRRTRRYDVRAVIDSRMAGRDAGELLDGRPAGIPICADLETALGAAGRPGRATHFVVGLAPDGGRLAPEHRGAVVAALRAGLHVDSGLHDFLSEDRELAALAVEHCVRIRDVRKPPPRSELHFFSGKIEQVDSLKVAVLGTDSAVGKRTTAWLLVDALVAAGQPAELVGTGQTAWLQGARWGIVLDSLVNDFLAGEIEHAVWSCWNDAHPRVIVLEGQGSLMNPAYPGGHELIAAGRPDAIVLQHAPARREYDGFPGYRIHPLEHQIRALEVISSKPVVAIGVNREGLSPDAVEDACAAIRHSTGLPAVDPLRHGADVLARAVLAAAAAARR
jgi:uncharacterized NAD-dependent epimerase/dehydratase family protein